MNWDVFWEALLISLIVIPLLYIWGFAICDLFVRRDIGNVAKVIWLLAIIFVPAVGTLAYFVTRPVTPLAAARRKDQYLLPGILASLDSLHASGEMSDSEYERRRAELTGTTANLTSRGSM